MFNILICDDDQDIVNALKIYLKNDDYQLFEAYSGKEALDQIEKNEIHCVLMDIMMPLMDGITATSKIREVSNIPIILLTAKSEDYDKVFGLEMGADDYITKPFNPLEVKARVKSQLRRYAKLGGMKKEESSAIVIGGIELDDEQKKVLVDGEEVSLTPSEYNILKFLMVNKDKVYSSAQIYENVWHESSFGSENTVAVHIRHLREKIEVDPADPRYLKVVWGLGYKFEGGRRDG